MACGKYVAPRIKSHKPSNNLIITSNNLIFTSNNLIITSNNLIITSNNLIITRVARRNG